MIKNKCLLVHCPKLFIDNKDICSTINYAAIGLYSLAGELKKSNFDVKIIHLGIEKYLDKNFLLSNYIKQNNIKFVAFSLNWYPQSYDVIETARITKEKCPDIHLSLGGYTASFFAEEIMEKYSFIDSVIKGEGEKSIAELVKRVYENKTFENIPNLLWRKGNKIIFNKETYVATNEDLDTFEFFNPENVIHYYEYSKVPYILDFSKKNQLENFSMVHGICIGRGCKGNCVWCGGSYKTSKLIFGRTNIAYRSSQNIISEIDLMKNKYNINFFSFSFDANPKDRNPIIETFKILSKKYNREINAIYNLDGLPDIEFLNAYKAAFSDKSVLMLSPIFANEKLRKKYKSFYYSNKQLEDVLKYMESISLQAELYFSIMPGVEELAIKESEKYGEYLKNRYKIIKNYYMYNINIEPGSIWTFYPEKYNLTNIIKSFEEYYQLHKGLILSFENKDI